MKSVLLNQTFGRVRTVIVLGVGRGGTSVIAGCLRSLGVCMGRDIHPLKHEWSPVVYSSDGRLDLDATYRAVAAMDAEFPLWGWKSPRDFGLFETVGGLLRDPGFIFVTRDILESALSGAAQQDMPVELGLYEAATVYRRIADSLRYLPWPTMVVSYRDALEKSEELVTVLCSFLDIDPGSAAKKQATDFIQPGTRAYRLFDAKREDAPVEISPEDLRMDSEDLAAGIGRRYGSSYLERFEKAMAETRSLLEKFDTKINREKANSLVGELIEQLCRLFASVPGDAFPNARGCSQSLQKVSATERAGAKLGVVLSMILDNLDRDVQDAARQLENRRAGSGLRDFRRVYFFLQLLLRVRAAVWRTLYLLDHSQE
jgi:hypothetical protein